MLNHIIIMGRMTADPELRRTGNGVAVTSFTLAVDRDFKNDSGEKETDFFDVVAWRHTAEFVGKYFTKGRMAIVAGKIQNRSWTDKDGNKRKTTEIIADNVYFGDSKQSSSGAAVQGGFGLPDSATPASDFEQMDGDDSQLPF